MIHMFVALTDEDVIYAPGYISIAVLERVEVVGFTIPGILDLSVIST